MERRADVVVAHPPIRAPEVRCALEQRDSGSVRHAILCAQAGQRDALSYLYARYADDVQGYVRSIVHSHDLAEDVTRQVFAKLALVIGKYDPHGLPLLAWILRLARNAAVDHLRNPAPGEQARLEDAGRAHELDHERAGELKDALAKLTPAQREVLILRHFVGLAPPEIAECTGRTEASIHALHDRGRRAFTAELSSRGAPPLSGSPRSVAAGGLP